MKLSLRTILIALMLPAFLTELEASEYYSLTNADGLSNNSITCITQDSSGKLWIGTWDGLNIYNSQSFRIFRHEPGKDNVISNNVIRSIQEQRPGIIWVSTDYGINRIDTENKLINRYYLGYEYVTPPSEKSFCMTIGDDSHVFCLALDWGISYFNELTGEMVPFNVPELRPVDIVEIFHAGQEKILARDTDGHVFILNYEFLPDGRIKVRNIEKPDLKGRITAAFEGKESIWLVSSENLLYRFGKRKDVSQAIPYRIGGSDIRTLCETKDSRLAIVSESSGAYLLDLATGEVTREPYLQDVNIMSLSQTSFQNILWIGTDGQGLRAVYDESFKMDLINGEMLSPSKRSPVRAFLKDGTGNLYVGTKGDGIKVFRDRKLIKEYNIHNGLTNNAVYVLKEGHHNDIFIGHDGSGIQVLSQKTGRIQTILPEKGKEFGSIYSITIDEDKDILWLGTARNGLVRLYLEMSGGRYRITRTEIYDTDLNDHSLNNNNVYPVLVHGDSLLWAGTRGGGLNRFDLKAKTFRQFTTSSKGSTVSSNEILCLHQSEDSVIWIGAMYGLNKMTVHKDGSYEFQSFTKKDGLMNETIHGILEDKDRNLWLSTNKGISVFNPFTLKITNYYNKPSLQDNEYADGAYYMDRDGIFYMGGVNGFNIFNPAEIKQRNFQPETLIESLEVRQRKIEGFRPDETLVLKHDERFFGIGFSALEYIGGHNCEYEYMLEGLDEDWVSCGTITTATYTNVPPGKYVFKVHCTNGDKVWSKKIATLNIHILRPWYSTIWAHSVYFIIGLAIGCVIAYSIRIKIRRKRRKRIETIRKQRQKEIFEAKLQFFTNIAHEFSSPLTLINSSIEQIRNTGALPPKVQQYNQIIWSNTQRMQKLIDELVEFRRVSTGYQRPAYSEVNIVSLIQSVADNFSERAEKKQIMMEFSLNGPETIVSDSKALDKILFNLISNACKYTPPGGHVSVTYGISEDQAVIGVRNSGKGIKPEDLPKVFDRFVILENYENQTKEGTKRHGIGMALTRSLVKMLSGKISVTSELDKETCFTVSLPLQDTSVISHSGNVNIRSTIEHKEASGKPQASEERTGRARVLIVDDEADIRSIVRDILGNEYRIIEAENGSEALETIRQEMPDLVISDLNMPVMNGMELLKVLKSSDVTKMIPVIFLAFRTDIGDEITTYENGCEAFIPKPFNPKHLVSVVNRILRNRTALKDYYSSAASSIDVFEGKSIDIEDKKFLTKITSLIEQNLTSSSLTHEWISEQMFISRTQLIRKIKELTGLTPSKFILEIKIKHAVHLLKTTKLTVQEIMFDSGFNNKSYFYRAFAEKYGMSPKDFRKGSM